MPYDNLSPLCSQYMAGRVDNPLGAPPEAEALRLPYAPRIHVTKPYPYGSHSIDDWNGKPMTNVLYRQVWGDTNLNGFRCMFAPNTFGSPGVIYTQPPDPKLNCSVYATSRMPDDCNPNPPEPDGSAGRAVAALEPERPGAARCAVRGARFAMSSADHESAARGQVNPNTSHFARRWFMKTEDRESKHFLGRPRPRAHRVLMKTAAVLGLGAAGGCSNGKIERLRWPRRSGRPSQGIPTKICSTSASGITRRGPPRTRASA